MGETITARLAIWVRANAPESAWPWLQERLATLTADTQPNGRELYITLGMIPRRFGKADLALSEGELAEAERLRPGWDPREWSVDEAARVLTLASLPPDGFAARLQGLCRSADVSEAIALYRGLPLYPVQDSLEPIAAEGVRTNIRAVFDAVAHRNPYPRECFSDERWNQMVLKALFIGSPLAPIQGLDERANPELAGMLCDYAHERWAAGRAVSPELWRCVGPFAADSALADLERVAASSDEAERRAAALALSASATREAGRILGQVPDEAQAVHDGRVTWGGIAATL